MTATTATHERPIEIMAGHRRTDHCDRCWQPIEWALKTRTPAKGGRPGKPAKYVPLNPNPLVLREIHNSGGVKLLVLPAEALHFVTCTNKRPARRA